MSFNICVQYKFKLQYWLPFNIGTYFLLFATYYVFFFQKAYPVSFAIINLVNYPTFVEKAVALFKPFVSSKLYARVSYTKLIKTLQYWNSKGKQDMNKVK